ncbi:MAG: PKD domain-containing protein [Thermoplasmata archaeon]|nr:PKD domain-containing protein [Thermoplasmata archaeon]
MRALVGRPSDLHHRVANSPPPVVIVGALAMMVLATVLPSGGTHLARAASTGARAFPHPSTVIGWTNLSPNLTGRSPPVLYKVAMVYDALDQYVLAFGGVGPGGNGTTWSFSSGSWTNQTVPGAPAPSARIFTAMTYDAADQKVLLFGGDPYNGGAHLNDTWEYAGGSWQNVTASAGPPPAIRSLANLAYDPVDGYAVLFGGYGHNSDTNDTWKFTGGTWTNITGGVGAAPSPRQDAAFAWDAADSVLLLFGGNSYLHLQSSFPRDTWTFAAGHWHNLTGTLAAQPPARQSAGMAFDGTDGYDLLSGGSNDVATCGLADTWSFRGNAWSPLSSVRAPSPRVDAGVAFDGSDGYTLLFGGRTCASSVNDTWNWGPISSTSALSATATANRTAVTPGSSVGFDGTATGGQPPYAWSWIFGDGSPRSSQEDPTHTYVAPGTYGATLTVNDSLLRSSQSTVTISVSSVGGGGITVMLVATPSTITLGQGFNLTSSVSGGTAPYSYGWRGMPSGCAGIDAPRITTCTPATVDTFLITVEVTDHLGQLGSANVTVVVNAHAGAPPTNSGTGAGLGGVWWIGLAIVAAVVVVALVLVGRRQPTAKPGSGSSGSPDVGPPLIPPGPR